MLLFTLAVPYVIYAGGIIIWRETKNRIIDPCSSEHDVKKQNLYVSIRGNFVNSLGFSGTIRCQGTWSTLHYNDVIMSVMASRITSLTIVYSSIYSGSDQRKHHSSASLAFVRGFHRWPVNSPHKWLVTRKMFPFDYVIMVQVSTTLKTNTFPFVEILLTHWGLVAPYDVREPTQHWFSLRLIICSTPSLLTLIKQDFNHNFIFASRK